MIDSSALLLTIVMSTPVDPMDGPARDQLSINTLEGIMQRLCWPHSTTLSSECDSGMSTAAAQQRGPDSGLVRALNTLHYRQLQR